MSPAIETITRAEPSTGSQAPRVVHIAQRDANGHPLDRCLCGYLWDRAFVRQGPMCAPCVEEFERLTGKPFSDPRAVADHFGGRHGE